MSTVFQVVLGVSKFTGLRAWRATRHRLLRRRRSSELCLRQPRPARRQARRVRAGHADGDGACRRMGCDRHGSCAAGSVCRRLAAIGLAPALLSRPGVRRVAGPAAEGVRRARRARGDDRHRAQRARAAGVRGAPDGDRHGGARHAPGHQQRSGVRDDGERADAGVWRTCARGGLLGRGQRRRRRALHARDLGLARSCIAGCARRRATAELLRAARVSAVVGAGPGTRTRDDAQVGRSMRSARSTPSWS